MKHSIGAFVATAASLLLLCEGAHAQTNLQLFYDFGSDRKAATVTMESFFSDAWGNTFMFADLDINSHGNDGHIFSASRTYWEIERCLNFWSGTALAPLSLQIEYNGGVGRGFNINNSYMAGLDVFLHSKDFRNTLNLKALYKYIHYSDNSIRSNLPLQFTIAWAVNDLFGLNGLKFSGFADLWWEEHTLYADKYGAILPRESHMVFITEPQLWYNIGRHFGCRNLNIGGEVELSYDYGSSAGFWCRPCAGIKWIF